MNCTIEGLPYGGFPSSDNHGEDNNTGTVSSESKNDENYEDNGEEKELSHREITGEKIFLRGKEDELDEKCNVFLHEVTHPASGYYLYVLARRLHLKGFIQFCSCKRCSPQAIIPKDVPIGGSGISGDVSLGFELFLQGPRKVIETYLKIFTTPSSIDNLINFNDLAPEVFWRGDEEYKDKGDFSSPFIFRFPASIPPSEQLHILNSWASLLVQMDILTNLRNSGRTEKASLEKMKEIENGLSKLDAEVRDIHKSFKELLSEVRRAKSDVKNIKYDSEDRDRKSRMRAGKGDVVKAVFGKKGSDSKYDPSFG